MLVLDPLLLVHLQLLLYRRLRCLHCLPQAHVPLQLHAQLLPRIILEVEYRQFWLAVPLQRRLLVLPSLARRVQQQLRLHCQLLRRLLFLLLLHVQKSELLLRHEILRKQVLLGKPHLPALLRGLDLRQGLVLLRCHEVEVLQRVKLQQFVELVLGLLHQHSLRARDFARVEEAPSDRYLFVNLIFSLHNLSGILLDFVQRGALLVMVQVFVNVRGHHPVQRHVRIYGIIPTYFGC